MLESGSLAVLNMSDILPNRFQPRIHFDDVKLEELANSIKKYGVIEPIIVRHLGDKYEIIAGERRYKASLLASKETIPAIVVNLSDRDSEEIALLENVQRQSLTPIEEAVSYKRILDNGYISQEELSSKVGKTQSMIAGKVKLLSLDDHVQDALLHGKISERHARSLLRLHDKNDQVHMLYRIINERLTVKRTDEEINKLLVSLKEENKAVPRASHSIGSSEKVKENKERNDNVDIDKILNEAQDINTEGKSANDVEQLMQQNPSGAIGNEFSNATLSSPEESVAPAAPVEQNKFVNVSAIPEESPKVSNEPVNNGVSFDSIFNQQPAMVQNNVSSASMSQGTSEVATPQPMPNAGNVVSPSVMPGAGVVNPTVMPAPSVNTVPASPTVSNAGMSTDPMAGNGMGAVNGTESLNGMNTMGNVASEPMPTPVTPINPIPVSVPAPEQSMASQNNVTQGVTPIDPINMNMPVNNGGSAPIQGVNPVNGEVQGMPQPTDMASNIPSSDIIENNGQVNEPNVQPQGQLSPELRQVISMIRNCASQIEGMGFYVDVDEIDLEKSYQVTFKINK